MGFTPDRALETITEHPFTQNEIDQILSNTEAQQTGAQQVATDPYVIQILRPRA